MKASEWIDRVKTARGWSSDYRVAKELDFKPNTISTYRANGGPMDENIAIKVANALGERPEAVLLDQYAERTKNQEARNALFGLANGLSIISKTAMLAIVVVAISPLDSSASAESTANQTPREHIMLSI